MPRKLKSGPGSRPGPRYQSFEEQRHADLRHKRAASRQIFTNAARTYLLRIVADRTALEKDNFVSGCQMISEVAQINYARFDAAPMPAQDLIATARDFADRIGALNVALNGLPPQVSYALDLEIADWLRSTKGIDAAAFLRQLESGLFALESIATRALGRVQEAQQGARTKPHQVAIRIAVTNLKSLFEHHGLNFSSAPTGRAAKCLAHILAGALPAVPQNLTRYLKEVQ